MTKSPDRPQLAKMLQIAERFGAQVEDDYGEKFTTPEAISEDPVKEWASERREWWWMFGSAMMCLCACIVFLAVGQFAVALFLGLSTGILSVACYFGGRIIFKS